MSQTNSYGITADSEYVGMMSEILAAVDKRDALVFKRVYKEALSTNEVTQILESGFTARRVIKDMVIEMVKGKSVGQ